MFPGTRRLKTRIGIRLSRQRAIEAASMTREPLLEDVLVA